MKLVPRISISFIWHARTTKVVKTDHSSNFVRYFVNAKTNASVFSSDSQVKYPTVFLLLWSVSDGNFMLRLSVVLLSVKNILCENISSNVAVGEYSVICDHRNCLFISGWFVRFLNKNWKGKSLIFTNNFFENIYSFPLFSHLQYSLTWYNTGLFRFVLLTSTKKEERHQCHPTKTNLIQFNLFVCQFNLFLR